MQSLRAAAATVIELFKVKVEETPPVGQIRNSPRWSTFFCPKLVSELELSISEKCSEMPWVCPIRIYKLKAWFQRDLCAV